MCRHCRICTPVHVLVWVLVASQDQDASYSCSPRSCVYSASQSPNALFSTFLLKSVHVAPRRPTHCVRKFFYTTGAVCVVCRAIFFGRASHALYRRSCHGPYGLPCVADSTSCPSCCCTDVIADCRVHRPCH